MPMDTNVGGDVDCIARFCCNGGTATIANGTCREPTCDDGSEPRSTRESCETFVTSQACVLPSDCVRRANDCCAFGGPTVAAYSAIHTDELEAFTEWQACGDMFACPPGLPVPQPYILATCQAGMCGLVDVREEAFTACADDSECRIRTNDCCECGGGTEGEDLVAVSGGGIEDLVCDPGAIGCPECGAVYPDDVRAVCTGGVCLAERF